MMPIESLKPRSKIKCRFDWTISKDHHLPVASDGLIFNGNDAF